MIYRYIPILARFPVYSPPFLSVRFYLPRRLSAFMVSFLLIKSAKEPGLLPRGGFEREFSDPPAPGAWRSMIAVANDRPFPAFPSRCRHLKAGVSISELNWDWVRLPLRQV